MSLLSRDFDETAPARQESLLSMLWRLFLIGVQVAFLIALSCFPLGLPYLSAVRPAFLSIAVYDWAVFAPHRLSPLGAFLSGLFFDLISGAPLGLNALTLLAVQRLTLRQRKFLVSQPYLVVWMGFFLVAGAVFALHWGVFSLFNWHLMDVRPALLGALFTALFFPPVARLLNMVNRGERRGLS